MPNPPKPVPEQLRKNWFKPGQSGNPAGKPKGLKNLLADNLLKDLIKFYDTNGTELLNRCFEEAPAKLLDCYIKLLPREIHASIESNSALFLSIQQRNDIAREWLLSAEALKEPALIEAKPEPKRIKKEPEEEPEPVQVKRVKVKTHREFDDDE